MPEPAALDSFKDVATRSLDDLRQRLGAEKASLQLVNGDWRTLFAASGFAVEDANRALLRPISHDPLVKKVVASGLPLFLPDPTEEPDWKPHPETQEIRSWIGAPIFEGARPVGFLTLDFLNPTATLADRKEDVLSFCGSVSQLLVHAGLLDDHRRLTRDMTLVREVVALIGEKLSTDDLWEAIANKIVRHLPCSHCTIFFPRRRDGKLLLVSQHAAGASEQTRSRVFLPDEGLAGWVFTNGKAAIVPDASADPRFAEARRPRPGTRSLLVVPIRVGDQTIGVISADQNAGHVFSESDADLVDTLARQAGIAIQRSVALKLLDDTTSKILALRDVDEILQNVVERAIELVNATTGVIYLFNASKRRVEKEYHHPDFAHPVPRLDKEDGATRTVIRTGRPLRVADLRSPTGVDPHPDLLDVYRSMIVVPLKVGEDVIGIFFVDDADEHNFSDGEESLLVTLANHAALAIEKARLLRDLHDQIARHEALERHMQRLHRVGLEQIKDRVDEVMDHVGEGIRAVLGQEVSPTIDVLVAPEGRTFEPPHAYGPLRDKLRTPPRAKGGTGAWVLENREPLYLPDVRSPPRGLPTVRDEALEMGVTSFAALPLIRDDQILGLLFVNSQKPISFTADQRRALTWFADQAAAAVESTRLAAEGGALRKVAMAFFKAAGREVKDEGPTELRVPEPVKVATSVPAARKDVSSLKRLLGPGETGYFLYKGEIVGNTLLALDHLRISGNPIVQLSEDTMTAALADGRARTVLAALEKDYRGSSNLFETRNALIDSRFLFGRRELLSRAGRSLLRSEHILLIGLRKAGKTSFLNILRQHLAHNPFAAIDLQRFDRKSEGWPTSFFQEIVASFDNWGRATFPGDWPAGETRVTNGAELQEALLLRREWQTRRGRHERLIVVLDELERVFPGRVDDEDAKRFILAAGGLRSLVQSSDKPFVSIIAADLRPDVNRINLLASAGTNPFFQFFEEMPLPPLSDLAIEEMVRSIGHAMGITQITRAFVGDLVAHAGGHPYLSRLLAGAAYRHKAEEGCLDHPDLKRGIEELDEDDMLGAFFRENFWNQLRDREKHLLRAAVRNGLELDGHDDFDRRMSAPARLSKRTSARTDRALLSSLGLICGERVPVGLFEEWIRNTALEGDENVA